MHSLPNQTKGASGIPGSRSNRLSSEIDVTPYLPETQEMDTTVVAHPRSHCTVVADTLVT